MGLKLSLQLFSIAYVIVFTTDVVLSVLNREATINAVVTDSGWWPNAFTTGVNVSANAFFKVLGSVPHAGLVLKSVSWVNL